MSFRPEHDFSAASQRYPYRIYIDRVTSSGTPDGNPLQSQYRLEQILNANPDKSPAILAQSAAVWDANRTIAEVFDGTQHDVFYVHNEATFDYWKAFTFNNANYGSEGPMGQTRGLRWLQINDANLMPNVTI